MLKFRVFYFSVFLYTTLGNCNVFGLEYGLTLQQRLDLERQKPKSTLKESTIETWKNRHVIFVPGIVNEIPNILSLYYKEQREVLEEDLASSFSFFNSSSRIATRENSDRLYRDIKRQYESLGKPVVLMGHSKGGTECLMAVLYHPELIFEGIVDRVILIQAAIHGSPLADLENRSIPLKLLEYILGDGLRSVALQKDENTIEHALDHWDNYLLSAFGLPSSDGDLDVHLNSKKAEFSDKIYYVRSSTDFDNLGTGVRIVLGVCRNNLQSHGESDGLLLVEHQMHERVGRDLGILQADHIGLTVSSVAFGNRTLISLNGLSKEVRIAFSRALFQQIYDDFDIPSTMNEYL